MSPARGEKENNYLKEVGQRLSERRKKLGLTQDEISNRSGLVKQSISGAETGHTELRITTFRSLCHALETSTDLMLDGCNPYGDHQFMGQDLTDLTEAQMERLRYFVKLYAELCEQENKHN